MDTILTLVNKGNDFLWSFLLLILLCGTGIYYTIRLKFIQVRKFGEGCKHVFGHFSLNGEKHEKGEMSPFQSIMTAIAAQVGTGNLAGADSAVWRRSGGNLLDVAERVLRNGDHLLRGGSGTDLQDRGKW